MRYFTYLAYLVFTYTFFIGGSAYVVFVLDRSAWWMLLGVFLAGSGYSPGRWIYGHKEDSDDD